MPHVCNKKNFEIFSIDIISLSKSILTGRNIILAGINPPKVKNVQKTTSKKMSFILVLVLRTADPFFFKKKKTENDRFLLAVKKLKMNYHIDSELNITMLSQNNGNELLMHTERI